MQHSNHHMQGRQGVLAVQGHNNNHIKMGRRKSLQQFHHFLLSSTHIINHFPHFRAQYLDLERTKTEKMGVGGNRSEKRVTKCFNYGPLSEIQYFNPQKIDEKIEPRKEINIIVDQQSQPKYQTIPNFLKRV